MASRKQKITTRTVEALKPGETVTDTELPGFMVRRQEGDARIYGVRKFANGRRHYVTIGEHGREGWTEAKARAEALAIIASLRAGRDPAADRAKLRGMPTLMECCERYLATRGATLKPGTIGNYRSFMRTHLDKLGRRKIDGITRGDVAALHARLKTTPRTANHILAFINAVFREAQASGHLPEGEGGNPASRIRRYQERKRERFLTESELDRLGEALASVEANGSEDAYAVAAIRLLMLTGCRRDEILSARWSWINFERGVMALPDSKTGEKLVHLNPAALELLSQLPRIEGNPFVIVGRKSGQRFVGLRKVWVRIRTAAKLEPVELPNEKLEHVRLHDLRHSFASLSAAGGASLLMIGKLLGHTNASTTQRYAHLCDGPLRRVNDAVGARVGAALKSRRTGSTEIVPLPVRA